MIAGIIGDVIGSVYEAYQWQRKDLSLFQSLPLEVSKDLEFLFKNNTKWKRTQYCWTDDTLCTLALYHAYINQTNPVDSMVYFCKKYSSESVGFGGNFTKWLDNPVPYQSYANGSIMRVGFIPYLPLSLEDKLSLAESYTNISHNHIDSLTAVKIFIETCEALQSLNIKKFNNSQSIINQYGLSNTELSKQYVKQILNQHGYYETVDSLHDKKSFEMNALTTMMQALVIVYESNSIEEVLRNTFYVGGDCDTLACIACNVAAHIYPLPDELLHYSLSTLAPYEDLASLVQHFEKQYSFI